MDIFDLTFAQTWLLAMLAGLIIFGLTVAAMDHPVDDVDDEEAGR